MTDIKHIFTKMITITKTSARYRVLHNRCLLDFLELRDSTPCDLPPLEFSLFDAFHNLRSPVQCSFPPLHPSQITRCRAFFVITFKNRHLSTLLIGQFCFSGLRRSGCVARCSERHGTRFVVAIFRSFLLSFCLCRRCSTFLNSASSSYRVKSGWSNLFKNSTDKGRQRIQK